MHFLLAAASLFLLLTAATAASPIVGAVIFPHGALALDPSQESRDYLNKTAAYALQEGIQSVSKWIAEDLQPDLIVMTTPHGISMDSDFGIYMNEIAQGSAEWEEKWKEFSVRLEIDTATAKQLVQFLKQEKQFKNVQGLTAFAPSSDAFAPLRWGEAIPLYHVSQLSKKTKYLLISVPRRRIDEAHLMQPELQQLGDHLYEFFTAQESMKNKRVAVIVSADLAHTHHDDVYFKYSDKAQPFDDLIGKWATSLQSELLLKNATEILYEAQCCGYTGFVMLDALLKHFSGVKGEVVVSPRHPTYYGMMVARYLWQS